MRIVHFLSSLNPIYGGPTASVPIQCIGTKQLGADMSLVTFAESKPWEGKLMEHGVNVIEIEKPFTMTEKLFALSLRRMLRKDDIKADLFHNHGIWLLSNHWVVSYGRKHAIKYVINPRGDLEIARINYDKLKKIKKQIAWWLYGKNDTQNASCIITTSEQEKEAVRKMGITAPIAIIPNGIETTAFPDNISHEVHKKKTILFLSRVNPIKGIEYLLDAWKAIPESERQNWQIHIAGNSDPKDYVKELEEKAAGLGITDSVKFVGPITGADKLEKYQNCDLFVLPTLNENFGNVVAEAMMCELPVITTKNAPWKVLEDYKCGWWIDLSVENLVNALVEAMSLNDEERWNLGKIGRRCIEENFASEAVAKKTMKVYEWVLGQGEKPEFVDVI